jgi:hypothetical protein
LVREAVAELMPVQPWDAGLVAAAWKHRLRALFAHPAEAGEP